MKKQLQHSGHAFLCLCLATWLTGCERGQNGLTGIETWTKPADISGTVNTGGPFDGFTALTVLFSPAGGCVRQTPAASGLVVFDDTDPLFTAAGNRPRLWNAGIANSGGAGEAPVTAMLMWDYAEGEKQGRAAHVDSAAEWLPVNVHTGQIFPR